MDSDKRDNRDGTPAWQRSEDDRQIDADAYHIWTPRPLIRSVYWRPEEEPPREAVSGSYEVFVDQRAFTAMHEHVWGAADDESPFGYLVGDLCEDPSANRRFVIVTQVIPSRFPFREKDAEQISGEASVAMQLEVERKRGVLVGWYHAHPQGPPELTPADMATHERLFPDPWQVAILFVTDPRQPAGATFRRTPEGLDGALPLPFYEMVTNESLLAKGVRRSRVDWENVSTLDTIRAEPPPRPQPSDFADPVEPERQMEPGEPLETALNTELESEPETESTPEPSREFEAEPDSESSLDLPEESEVGTVPSAERPEEALSDPPVSAADDLDFDALIAEVERAGLETEEPGPELETEGVSSGDTAEEPASAYEDVFEALSEVEEDLAAAERSRRQMELPADEVSPVELSAEAAPTFEEAAEPEPVEEGKTEPGTDPLIEPAGNAAGGQAAAVEIATAPPESGEGERTARAGLRRWALPALGLVVAFAVIALLVRGIGSGENPEPRATPDPIESATAEREGAVRVAEPSTGVTEDRSSAGEAAAEDPTGEVPVDGTAPDEGGVEIAGEGGTPDPEARDGEVADPAATSVSGPVSIETLRSLSDSVVQAISTFYGRTGAFDRGEIECQELQASFVEVMDSWIDYSTRGRAGWQGRMPPDVAERDERLYLGVQDVERLFEGSSCPRP
jgi:proteasome lid subunit RPN8/RPN11